MWPFDSQPQNTMDAGRNAMTYFHNRSLQYPGYSFKLDEMLDIVSKGHTDIFLDGLGTAIGSIEMREAQIRDAMYALADQAQGRLPANQSAFFQALSSRVSNISFVDYIYGSDEIAVGIAKDIGTGAQAVGEKVVATASFLTSPLGILAIVGTVAVVGLGYLKVTKVI